MTLASISHSQKQAHTSSNHGNTGGDTFLLAMSINKCDVIMQFVAQENIIDIQLIHVDSICHLTLSL